MKKYLSIILSIIMLLSILPVSIISIGAATSHTQSEAVAWINSAIGQYFDYDGYYGAQCVDLIAFYYRYLGASVPGGNACDYAINALPNGWTRISYYSGFIAQPGDIAVWNSSGVSINGHVALVVSATSSTMNVVEENHNGTGTQAANAWTYNYVNNMNFYGVIRPDFTSSSYTYTPINPGTYYLVNSEFGKAVSVSYSLDVNTQDIDLYDYSQGNASEMIRIENADDGYKMRPMCSESRVINPYSDNVRSGVNVNLYDDTYNSTQWWKFQEVSGGYIIHNVQNPSCVLDESNGSVVVNSYDGSASQIWRLIEHITVDKSALSSAIERAKSISADNYTSNSYAALQNAIQSAETVNANSSATQAEVDNAVENLKTAINKLAKKIDKSRLESEITVANKINGDSYTADSYNAFQEVLISAEAVFENANADQETVNNAIENLKTAINKLVKKIDKSRLESEITIANKINGDSYTEESYNAFQKALTAAQAVLEDAKSDQKAIDNALEALETAISSLKVDTQSKNLLGDLNGDGDINATDATLILQFYAGIIKDDEPNVDISVADVDKNGEIDATDATLILQLYAGIIHKF